MIHNIGSDLLVQRGVFIPTAERKNSNIKDINVKKAYLVGYDDIKPYEYNSESTLKKEFSENKVIYADLSKKFKNARLRNYDIVISQRSFYTIPHLVFLGDDDLQEDYIYDNRSYFFKGYIRSYKYEICLSSYEYSKN